MSREATFNFIPATQLAKPSDTGITVSFNRSNKYITFDKKQPKSSILVGSFVKFFVDTSKNTLAWKVFRNERGLDTLKDHHQIKIVNVGKYQQIKLYVPAVAVNALKLKEGAKYSKMEVKTYKPQGLLEDQAFNYISFK